MIVQRLMWPLVRRRVEAPGTPPWFRRLVRAQLDVRLSMYVPHTHRIMMSLGIVVLTLIVQGTARSHGHDGVWDDLILWVMFFALIGTGELALHAWQEIKAMRASGDELYARATKKAEAALTGHRKMEYLAAIHPAAK